MSYGHLKLGKKPKKEDPRTLKLATYLDKKLVPEPPATSQYLNEVGEWGMLDNDSIGDCVEAAQLHLIEEETAYATGKELVASNEDAILLYEQEGGYIPGDPNTDNGTVILDALKFARSNGVLVGGTIHKVAAFLELNLSDSVELRQSIYLFGGAIIGVDLPVAMQEPPINGVGTPVWVYPGNQVGGNAPGSWGGHCVPIVGYMTTHHRALKRHRYQVISWGEEFWLTPDFLKVYGSEGWVVLSEDWFNPMGLDVHGFNKEALRYDLEHLK